MARRKGIEKHSDRYFLATLNGAKFPTLEESGLIPFNQAQSAADFDSKTDEILERQARKRLEEMRANGK